MNEKELFVLNALQEGIKSLAKEVKEIKIILDTRLGGI